MRYLLLVLPLLAGCQSFTKCDEIIDLLEVQTGIGSRSVYDDWNIKVTYSETGFKNFSCTVSVSGAGFLGPKDRLERRPTFLDELLHE